MVNVFGIALLATLVPHTHSDFTSIPDIPEVAAWELPNGTTVFNQDHLVDAGIDCEIIMCAYPLGTTAMCDDGGERVFAASGDLYDQYETESGAREVRFNLSTETLVPNSDE